MFLIDLPNPTVRIEHVLDTIDRSMPGGHAILSLENLRVPHKNVLGQVNLCRPTSSA
jgi:acyl-CoA dehydrogenase